MLILFCLILRQIVRQIVVAQEEVVPEGTEKMVAQHW